MIDIPAPIASRLERALAEAGIGTSDSVLLSRLSQAHHPLAASDAAWQEPGISDDRREALAQVSRSLGGLNTVLQVLWAALAHNRMPGGQGAVAAHVLQGLVLAGRELVDGANDALHAVDVPAARAIPVAIQNPVR